MDKLGILLLLWLIDYIYKTFIKNLTVINLNYAVSSQIIERDEIKLEINLNRHFWLKSRFLDEDYRLANPTIHLSLPHKIFPEEKDMVSFEYELMLVNIKDYKTINQNCIIIVKLIDLSIDKAAVPSQ